MIIRNAENICADEIEGILLRDPWIVDAAVIGVSDERTGERGATVLVIDGPPVALAELALHCADCGLAAFKSLELVEVAPALPRNSMGEILKDDLRKRYAAQRAYSSGPT